MGLCKESRSEKTNLASLDEEQVTYSREVPSLELLSLTFRAVPDLATAASDMLVIALRAGRHMSAERFCLASLDGRHHFQMAQADMANIDLPLRRTIIAQYDSDLQL